jgi:uncharacterized protein YPO0396
MTTKEHIQRELNSVNEELKEELQRALDDSTEHFRQSLDKIQSYIIDELHKRFGDFITRFEAHCEDVKRDLENLGKCISRMTGEDVTTTPNRKFKFIN